MVLVCTLGLESVGQAQMGAGMVGGTGSIPGTPFGGATDPGAIEITEGFRIIPTIAVGERYDSNVFFEPKTPGVDRSDYVTTVVPQIRGLFAGSAMTVNATVGGNAQYYVKNPDLNYIGANAGLSLDLSPMMSQLWKGMTLMVGDRFAYTPQPPSFLVGNHQGDTSNPLTNGQQVGRVNSTSNVVSTTVSAPLTQTLSLTGGYSNGFLHFGTPQVQQVNPVLSSTYQTFTVGMSMTLSPQDSVSLSFLDSEFKYEQGGSFSSRGGLIGWNHVFSPNVTLTSAAGATVLQQGSSSGSGAQGSQGQSSGLSNVSTTVAPTSRVALTWREKTTTLALGYGLTLTPSYQFQAQPLLTNILTFSVTQQTPIQQLQAIASANYGRGDEIGSKSVNAVSYASFLAVGGVVYKFTPKTFLTLIYSYGNYDNQFGATNSSYDRQLVSLTLAQALY